MKTDEILADVRVIKAALGAPVDDMERRCIGCKPIIDALLLLNELERELSADYANAPGP